jgi:hypothetical protein
MRVKPAVKRAVSLKNWVLVQIDIFSRNVSRVIENLIQKNVVYPQYNSNSSPKLKNQPETSPDTKPRT